MANILIIDDDPGLLQACSVGLEALGHRVRTVETGTEALILVGVASPDVVVLDLGLPDLDGLEVYARIRERREVPVLILSADGDEDRKVEALNHGTDDYLVKPIGLRELDARVRSALRHRPAGTAATELVLGALRMDTAQRRATLRDVPLDLTPKEFDFLACLAAHEGRVCGRQTLLETVWGPDYRDERHYLKVYAYRVRRKLGDPDGRIIKSEQSLGYRLVPPAA